MSQPTRKDGDGRIEVQRVGDYIDIRCTTDNREDSMSMGEYNAWRLFGMLSTILGIQLPKQLAKNIKIT